MLVCTVLRGGFLRGEVDGGRLVWYAEFTIVNSGGMTKQLCQSEWTVLQSLWERQPQTLMQLVEDLKVRVGWSASTSKTMAARMSEKGLLRYEGKPRRYYPNVTREEAGFEETEQLLSRAFGGRLGLLVSNFADHGKIGKDELDELYAILDKAAGRGE